MAQTYLPRRKVPQDSGAGRPDSPARTQAPAPGVLPEASADQGAQLAARMNQRMSRQFGSAFPGAEDLSGVQVHYNSPLPDRVDAEAYTQGEHIYLAAGQERHLAHELGHVLQQRRGHVPTTERIGGLAANTDPALEREADQLGRQFAGAVPEIAGGVGSFGGPPAAADAAAPIQMAGHKGVMQFGSQSIVKRIEKNEYDEYRRVMEQQTNTEVDPETRRRALAAFPRIYGVYTQAQAEQENFPDFDGDKGKQLAGWIQGNGKALQDARAKAGGGEPENEEGYYVQMESMGGAGFSVKDFKVGTFTANAEELYQHGHKGSKGSALKKEHKMRENDDARSETARYGLRDSDEIQKGMNPLRKFMAGQRIDTLGATREQVKGGRYQGGTDGGGISQVIEDLNGIEEYFQNSDTVYVASSVIIKWAKEGGGDRDQARLIDLAHPIRKGKASEEVFQAAREGMLLGIRNVRNLLLGGSLEERGEEKLPIGVGNLETRTPGGEQPNDPRGQPDQAPAAPAPAADNPLEAMFLQAPAQGKGRRKGSRAEAPEDLLVAAPARKRRRRGG